MARRHQEPARPCPASSRGRADGPLRRDERRGHRPHGRAPADGHDRGQPRERELHAARRRPARPVPAPRGGAAARRRRRAGAARRRASRPSASSPASVTPRRRRRSPASSSRRDATGLSLRPVAPRCRRERATCAMPNVNPVVEMTDLITATRAYEANTTADQRDQDRVHPRPGRAALMPAIAPIGGVGVDALSLIPSRCAPSAAPRRRGRAGAAARRASAQLRSRSKLQGAVEMQDRGATGLAGRSRPARRRHLARATVAVEKAAIALAARRGVPQQGRRGVPGRHADADLTETRDADSRHRHRSPRHGRPASIVGGIALATIGASSTS